MDWGRGWSSVHRSLQVGFARFLDGGFLKWWVSPTTMGFPTKNDDFEVFWGYHFRKHPDGGNLKIFGIFTPKIWGNDSKFDVCIFFKGVGEKPPTRF